MNILDYFIVVILLFLVLFALKNIINEKANCVYCKHKEQCRNNKKKERKKIYRMIRMYRKTVKR